MKLKKGDKVKVITGKDKGKEGTVEKILASKQAVLVSGVNLYRRHLKKRDEKQQGGIVEIAKPLTIAKVAFICPKCKVPTRVGYKVMDAVKKRICRKCGQTI